MRIRTDAGRTKECQCELIETLYDYCPGQAKMWWPSTAQIGTKRMYLPSPEPVVYVVPLSHILGKLPLIPAGDHCTIPRSMHGRNIHWACAIVRASQARAVLCSTSTRGPWSGPLTTRHLSLETCIGIKRILCELASDGLPQSLLAPNHLQLQVQLSYRKY
jgi:hypothetical protein